MLPTFKLVCIGFGYLTKQLNIIIIYLRNSLIFTLGTSYPEDCEGCFRKEITNVVSQRTNYRAYLLILVLSAG